ncbi:MAG TPA: tetratricopeptide repeat protein [Gemmatirosa sp.]
MNGRINIARRAAVTAAGLGALAALLPLTSATAQQRGTPDPNAPRVMVAVFRSTDKNSGVRAADAVRDRLIGDFNLKQLYVLPKADINANLEASGFPTNEALAPHDARALAQQLRADEYVTGTVSSTGGQTRVDAAMVLTRDNSLVQPLGSYQVNKPDQAAQQISREFEAAQRAFTAERDCVNNARDKKIPEAVAAAQRGIAAYPKTTLARVCLANIYVTQRDQDTTNAARVKTYNDSALGVARQILALDANSLPALRIQYAALQAAGQRDSATNVLLRLVAADPTNTRLREQVINEYAANGQASSALPLVKQLVTDNPGDPTYLQLQTRVQLAAKDYKGAVTSFQELAKEDTTSATADLYSRVAIGARLDSQPQVASQLLAEGVKRYPNNGGLLTDYADALAASGQTQQAIDLLNRMAQTNPKTPGLYTAMANLYTQLKRPDDAFKALQQAQANGDSASTISDAAVNLGATAYQAASASKSVADYQRAISILEFANKTNRTDRGQFFLGVASLGLGGQLLQDAQKNRSCEAVAGARTAFNTAQLNLPAGGRVNPQGAQQALAALAQYSPYPDQLGAALKCGSAPARSGR